jgi:hypothetical protein
MKNQTSLHRRAVLVGLAGGFVALDAVLQRAFAQMGRGGGPGYVSATAESGKLTLVAHTGAGYSNSPTGIGPFANYSVKIQTPPKNGKATLQRVGTRTNVFYQSKKGFVGQDEFQYVRVSDDRLAGVYTVAVTVR